MIGALDRADTESMATRSASVCWTVIGDQTNRVKSPTVRGKKNGIRYLRKVNSRHVALPYGRASDTIARDASAVR
jgi:hypothetical protein